MYNLNFYFPSLGGDGLVLVIVEVDANELLLVIGFGSSDNMIS